MENNGVSHEGVVQSINGSKVMVRMTVSSACAGCHAKSICGVADRRDKVVETLNTTTASYEVGEKVMVQMRQTLAAKAILICYLFPFIVLFASFCLMYLVSQHELLNVLVSFAATAIYFFFVWLFRKKIEKNVVFVISKIPQI